MPDEIIPREPTSWREKRNGKRRYVGQVLRLKNSYQSQVLVALKQMAKQQRKDGAK